MDTRPKFHSMSLNELAAWVSKNNGGLFDVFPDDEDDEEDSRQEYEAMADDIYSTIKKYPSHDDFLAAIGPCGK